MPYLLGPKQVATNTLIDSHINGTFMPSERLLILISAFINPLLHMLFSAHDIIFYF